MYHSLHDTGKFSFFSLHFASGVIIVTEHFIELLELILSLCHVLLVMKFLYEEKKIKKWKCTEFYNDDSTDFLWLFSCLYND